MIGDVNSAGGLVRPEQMSIYQRSEAQCSKEQVVGVAEFFTAFAPQTLMCIGLGSCVGIAIYDLRAGLGGLAHAMLPRFDDGKDKQNASKYADSVIYVMVDELIERGASKANLKAKIAGGAQMFQFVSSDTLNIGIRNSEVAKETLKKERITLVAEDVGGTKGRTVRFNPSDGTYLIQKGGDTSSI